MTNNTEQNSAGQASNCLSQGLDYNTKRGKMTMPEYGRIVQQMIEYTKTLEKRSDRQRAAEKIVNVMATMSKSDGKSRDFQHKLWNHLALMSNFELDIDYPFDVEQAKDFANPPHPISYPTGKIGVKHYGKMLMETCDIIASMSEGRERDELSRLTANQMRRTILEYGHCNARETTVLHDLERFTDGRVRLNPNTFVFDKSVVQMEKQSKKRKKKHRN